MNFFAVLNHWLHLISVVIWVGGAAFQVFVAAPLLKTGDPSYNFLKGINKRFRRIVGPLLFILVVTGGINFGVRSKGYEFVPSGYISALGVKVFLFVAIASLYFFGVLRSRYKDEEEEEPRGNQPTLPEFVSTRLTLIIGLIIIFLASMLRQWKF
jgi:putative copper export protein